MDADRIPVLTNINDGAVYPKVSSVTALRPGRPNSTATKCCRCTLSSVMEMNIYDYLLRSRRQETDVDGEWADRTAARWLHTARLS